MPAAQQGSSLRALHRTYRRLRLIIDHLPQGVIVADVDGTVLLANAAGARLLAASVAEAEGRRFAVLEQQRSRASAERADSAPRTLTAPSGALHKVRITTLNSDIDDDAACVMWMTVDEEGARSGGARLDDQVLRDIVDRMPNIVYGKDVTGHFIYANRATARAFGTTVDDLIGRHESELSPVLADTGRYRALQPLPVDADGSRVLPEHAVTDATGAHRILQTVSVPVKERGVFGICVDVTEQRRMEGSLRIATEVFDRCRESIMVTDPVRCVIFVNPAFTTMTGFSADEIVGRSADSLRSGHYDAAFYAGVWSEVDSVGYWQGCLSSRRKSGDLFDQWLSITAVRNAAGSIERYISIAADVTSYKHAQARVSYLAHYDTVTGLPNRALLHQRLSTMIEETAAADGTFGVLYLDLDRFKQINDSFGHHVGDQMLCEVATRLQGVVSPDCTVARYGGDEFVVLLAKADEEGAAVTAAAIRARVAAELIVSGVQLRTTASVGVSLYPNHGATAVDLLKNADLALHHAKLRGRNHLQFFTPSMTHAARERLRIEAGLRRALEHQAFCLHYQPQIDLVNGRLIGAEALIRWLDPDRGLVGPGDFITVAEDSGLIVPIGEWVIAEVCRQQRAWNGDGRATVPIAVNVSALQFQTAGFVARTVEALAQHGVPGSALCLEITESVLLRNPDVVGQSMRQLADAGIRLALDDFGTGFSSLNYLKQLPLHRLKIDASFVKGLPDNEHDVAIVRAVLSLAHHLGIEVVAEGVEVVEQARFLTDSGCRFAQGFLWGEAVPAADFQDALRTGSCGQGVSNVVKTRLPGPVITAR